MELSFLLVTVCMLNSVQAYWGWGPCPKSVGNGTQFEYWRFSYTSWFEYKRSNVPKWEEGTQCNKLRFGKIPGKGDLIFTRPGESSENVPVSIDEQPGTSINEGKLRFTYTFPSHSYVKDLQVAATDFHDFILTWTCSNYFIFHTEGAQIWSKRNYDIQPYVDIHTERALKLINPQLEFTKMNQENCPRL